MQTCKKCGATLRMYIPVLLDLPATDERATKRMLRSSEVRVLGFYRDRQEVYCPKGCIVEEED